MVDTLQSDQDIDADIAALSKFGRMWLLTVAALGVLLVIASMVALNAALPDLALQTAATQTQLTWVVDGYTLVLACLLLPAGALGDRYGRRGALIVGLTIFAIASFAPTFLDSPVQIIVARAVAGVGAAFIMPATLSLLTAAFPKEDRNKAIGIWAGMASSGAIVGFMGTGLLLRHFEWQSIFYAFAIASVAMILCALTIRSSRDETDTPVDWIGAAIIGGALAVFVFGVVEAPVRGWTHPVVWGCMTAGVALGVAFALVELRRRHPLLDVRLFAKPDFTVGAVGITSLFFANFGFFFIVMQYMQLILGYSPLQTAWALAPLAVPIVVLGVTMHLILPRLGLRLMVAVGLLLIAIGLFCMRFLQADSAYIDLVWPFLITSAGIGMCVAPATSAIMNAVPTEKQGVASAVNDTTREVGAALGIAVAGSVLAAQYTHAIAPGLQNLPDQVRGVATDSLASALEAAKQLGAQGPALSRLAETAFLDAMGISLIVLSAAVAAAGAFVALWAPGRDGEQFRFVRRRSGRASVDNELGGPVAEHDDSGVRAATGDGR
jgi:EmrB/QacA subfamily drug resistance transporter